MKRVEAWTAANGDGDVVSHDEEKRPTRTIRRKRRRRRHFLPFGSPEKSSRTSFCICLSQAATLWRKVLTRFGERQRATVRAAVEQRRIAIVEFVGGWRKIERGTRRKVWEPLARAMRRMRQMKAFWAKRYQELSPSLEGSFGGERYGF